VQVHKNGVALAKLKETHNTSTTEEEHFTDWEDTVLVAGDYLTAVHTISSGTITATKIKLELKRLN